MPEVRSAREWVQLAFSQHWAIGQFNVSNLETIQAVTRAARACRAPVFVGTSMGTIRYAGLAYLAVMVRVAKSEAEVPVFLHLDHGEGLDVINACLEMGYDSVMVDGSRLPFEDNVRLVRTVVALARPRGVAVEAQIGEVPGEDSGYGHLAITSPEQARQFVQLTQVDYLAVSIGTTPGRLEGESSPDLDLLRQIHQATGVPLVLHGGSSVPDAVMRAAIESGIAKVNIDAAIRRTFTSALAGTYAAGGYPTDPRKVLAKARDAVESLVAEKIRLFGSQGKV